MGPPWFHPSTPSKCCPKKRWAPDCVTMQSKILGFPAYKMQLFHPISHNLVPTIWTIPLQWFFLNLSHVSSLCRPQEPKKCIRFQPLSSSQSSGRLTSGVAQECNCHCTRNLEVVFTIGRHDDLHPTQVVVAQGTYETLFPPFLQGSSQLTQRVHYVRCMMLQLYRARLKGFGQVW